jgi:hypothetical protein
VVVAEKENSGCIHVIKIGSFWSEKVLTSGAFSNRQNLAFLAEIKPIFSDFTFFKISLAATTCSASLPW